MIKKKILYTLLLLSLFAILLLRPVECMASVQAGIHLFFLSVVPSLFPFFVLSRLLVGLDGTSLLARPFSRPYSKLFHLPPECVSIFILSILSGFPIGAKLISEFYHIGKINTKQATALASFCSNTGPMFLIGTIGSALFHNPLMGLYLFIVHVLAALLTGVLFTRKLTLPRNSLPKLSSPTTKSNLLADSIYDSVLAILQVGGTITLCYMLTDILLLTGLIRFPILGLNQFFGWLGLPFQAGEGIIFGLFELTRGCFSLSKLGFTPFTLIALSGLIGFSSFSIQLQQLAFLKPLGIRASTFCFQRMTHAVLAMFFAFLISLILF